ncbi:MAG: Peptidase M50 [Candidatus Woesebacteria bacterium GW2011_GWC2_45_9]|uniref:Peptidase M50 n=1 Tax=Candidatus Woesebacteria bacterium GW2011_GWC2_45_9 TaxID=1618589 RepID=A0A0G1N6K2_9BACT|nr:MAG: Peptidase M50 [Candidatus Woesebacteria bacterium GW2011_GWC2_45_9]
MTIIIWLLAFAVAITIHEAAHAWMADRLGDPTPRIMGRLSLNPLVHYDPIGTTLLLVLVILRSIGFPVIPFGWAKPVRFDPYNLANPRRDAALISLAGPAANLLLAIVLALFLRFLATPFSPLSYFSAIFYPFIILNVVLAIFNLLPIHPLDGGKVLVGLLPRSTAHEVDMFMNRYGILILFLLIFPTVGGASLVSIIIFPLINIVLSFLIPGSPVI